MHFRKSGHSMPMNVLNRIHFITPQIQRRNNCALSRNSTLFYHSTHIANQPCIKWTSASSGPLFFSSWSIPLNMFKRRSLSFQANWIQRQLSCLANWRWRVTSAKPWRLKKWWRKWTSEDIAHQQDWQTSTTEPVSIYNSLIVLYLHAD